MGNNVDNTKSKRPRNVCLFGLSGDPPTGTAGHMGMVQQLLSFCRNHDNHKTNGASNNHTKNNATIVAFDEIWILPVYRHTFSEKRERLITFEHRLEMCRLAFLEGLKATSSQPRLVVSDAEYHSWKRAHDQDPTVTSVGTAALLEYLLQQEEATNKEETTVFSFCLGADSFESLMQGKWRESERVRELLRGRFWVMNRVQLGEDDQEEDETQQQGTRELEELVQSVAGAVLLPPNPALGSVSSSQVRELLQKENANETAREQLNDERLISQLVLAYIHQHGLYAPLESTTIATKQQVT